jgi:DNA-binding beta-propeller fold protein YncE
VYVVDTPPSPNNDGPVTPTLASYDVVTGQKIGQLTLTGISAGNWMDAQSSGNDPLIHISQPGYALAPDGHTIGVLAPNSDVLSLIDTSSMKLIQQHTLSAEPSLLDRIGEWLGVVPTAAFAKRIEGTIFSITFSPDGKSLYVTGTKYDIQKDGTMIMHGLGVQVVDATTGHIVAQGLSGKQAIWLQPSPDGNTLYALSLDPSVQNGCACTLQRFDVASQHVTATRTFAYPQQVFLFK